jgi:hypothetical protein
MDYHMLFQILYFYVTHHGRQPHATKISEQISDCFHQAVAIIFLLMMFTAYSLGGPGRTI